MTDQARQGVDAVKAEVEMLAVHKHAFRTAYEYLQEMWPPAKNADYFTLAGTKAAERYVASKMNPLAEKLLGAVLSYLSDTVTQEKDDNG